MAQTTSPQQPSRLVIDFGRLGSPLTILLIGLGLLIIGVGANGIRSNGTVVQQMPYLLTGGVLGLAFVMFGCAYLIVQNARQDRVRLEAKLDLLAEAVLEAGGRRLESSPGDASGLVVAGTASYHLPGCRLVDGREQTSYLTPAEAGEQGLKACRVCQPETATTEVSVR
jgi:hypothetical protein